MEESAVFAPVEQEEIRADIGALFRGAIRVTPERLLKQEVREMVGARRYERLSSRKDDLNGTYLRRLLTSMGEVELAVPRTRHSGAPAEVVGSHPQHRRLPRPRQRIATRHRCRTRNRSRVGRSPLLRHVAAQDRAAEGCRRLSFTMRSYYPSTPRLPSTLDLGLGPRSRLSCAGRTARSAPTPAAAPGPHVGLPSLLRRLDRPSPRCPRCGPGSTDTSRTRCIPDAPRGLRRGGVRPCCRSSRPCRGCVVH